MKIDKKSPIRVSLHIHTGPKEKLKKKYMIPEMEWASENELSLISTCYLKGKFEEWVRQ